MRSDLVKITDSKKETYILTVSYTIKAPQIITGGYELPKYIDDEENTYIEIIEITGTLPPDFSDHESEYRKDITDQLNEQL